MWEHGVNARSGCIERSHTLHPSWATPTTSLLPWSPGDTYLQAQTHIPVPTHRANSEYTHCHPHAQTHAHKHLRAHTRPDTRTQTLACTHTPRHTHTNTCVHTHAQTHAHKHLHAHTHPDTRTQTLAHTHMTENLQVFVALHTALVLRSQSLGTPGLCPAVPPPLCPLLGLPQGTQYPRTPLHPPPQQEKGLREPLRPTSTCSISSLVPTGPGDPARLEMSPSPQGSGHRGQAQAADPSFSLPANGPHEGR